MLKRSRRLSTKRSIRIRPSRLGQMKDTVVAVLPKRSIGGFIALAGVAPMSVHLAESMPNSVIITAPATAVLGVLAFKKYIEELGGRLLHHPEMKKKK